MTLTKKAIEIVEMSERAELDAAQLRERERERKRGIPIMVNVIMERIGYWSITTITTHDVHVPRKCSQMYSTIADNRHTCIRTSGERIYQIGKVLASIRKKP